MKIPNALIESLKKFKKQIVIIGCLLVLVLVYLYFNSNTGVRNYSGAQIESSNKIAYISSDESYAVYDGTTQARSIESFPGMPTPVNEAPYNPEEARMLVKTGSLSFVVKDITATRDKILQVVEEKDGFISSQNFSQGYSGYDEQLLSAKSGSLTLRVPNESFEEVVKELRKFALVVTNESVNTNDVTEQYTDLRTRLTNKLQEENQYRQILKQATKISDILEVTRYIEQARTDAERMQGQLDALDNTIVMSTLYIYLESERQYEIGGVSWSPIDNVKESYQKMIQGITSVIDGLVAIIVLMPLLLLYAVLLWLGYVIIKKMYNKISK